jgi:D-glycero-D-manno-heptose 1,7-bisphosphate phosphatase
MMHPSEPSRASRASVRPAQTPASPSLQAVFFDRDGTLIEHRPYLASPEGVALLPGVSETLGRLHSAGVKLFLFTNQSGVGRGLFTMADVDAVNRRMIDLIGMGDDVFADVCVAPERPDEPPVYRKPSPRFIREMIDRHGFAADAAWMLGDSPSDWQAGLNAGIQAAAIIPDHLAVAAFGQCAEQGVTIYPDLHRWCQAWFP